MGDLINFNGITSLDIDADVILKAAIGKMEKVIIAGLDKEGNEYFASSMADGGDALWYLKRCEKRLLTDDQIEE